MNDTQESTTQTTIAPNWKRYLMPGLVLGFLGGHMLFIGFAITLAVGQGSLGIIPDYYQKGVDWDDHKAALAASEELGWQVEIHAQREVNTRGERALVITIQDREGIAISGAAVNLTLFHHAHASDQIEVALHESEPGVYHAHPIMPKEGVWDFTLEVLRDEERFISIDKKYVRGGAHQEASP